MRDDREDFRSDDDVDYVPEPESNDDLGRDYPEADVNPLPRRWNALPDRKLSALRDEVEQSMEQADSEDEAELYQYQLDLIDEELYNRKYGDDLDPIDYDEQDRRAAAEERIENHRRER